MLVKKAPKRLSELSNLLKTSSDSPPNASKILQNRLRTSQNRSNLVLIQICKQFSTNSHIQYPKLKLSDASLVVKTRLLTLDHSWFTTWKSLNPGSSVHKKHVRSLPVPPLSCSFLRVMLPRHWHAWTDAKTHNHTHTHTRAHSHTHTNAHTRTYAWKVPATRRANSCNDLRPSEPTYVNVSRTRRLNWHFPRSVWTPKKRVHPSCLHVDHSRSLC